MLCFKAAIVDTARSISTQSKQRIRMRMQDVGGAQPRGRRSDRQLGLHCVGGRSQVLPTPFRPPFPCSPSDAKSAPIVPRLPRLRISLARNTTRSAVYLLLFHAAASRRKRERERGGGEEGGAYARPYPDRT